MRISDWSSDVCSSDLEMSGRSRSYAIAPSLEWVVNGGWRLSLVGTIAQDRTRFRNDAFTGTSLGSSSTGCYCNKERSVELSGAGTLATLPGGDIKSALGGGYRTNRLDFFADRKSTRLNSSH